MSSIFNMLDLDNDGEIDREEFMKVINLVQTKHRKGVVHHDGCHRGSKVVEQRS